MSGGISPLPTDDRISTDHGVITAVWRGFFESLNIWLGPVGTSGATSSRPNDTSRHPLYVGQAYFDTTLGYPVYVKSRNPTVWVDGGGTVR